LSDEVWVKDTEIGRLREEKEKLKMELERANRLVNKVGETKGISFLYIW